MSRYHQLKMTIAMNMNIQQTARDQSGFTLIEAMIALLIFSVGLLGLAGMQMSGLQNNHKSLMRTHVIQFSYDMADSLRARINGANPDNLLADAYFDKWDDDLADKLPGGRGQIVRNDLLPGIPGFDITVFWDEDRTGAVGVDCNPADAADLRCLTITVVP